MDDYKFMEVWEQFRADAIGKCDWLIMVDIDEVLWTPEGLRATLENAGGCEVIRSAGYNMTGDGLPKDDGRQIYEISPWGVKSPVYSKTVIIRPEVQIQWALGRHFVEHCSGRISPKPMVKLLHYRYMGYSYTRDRNARNYERAKHKHCAWSCDPSYKGEHSAEWSEVARKEQFNVLESPMYDCVA